MAGKRKFFHGTMNSSKTAQILMQVHNFERQGKKFIIFKPKIDTRDGLYVKSRAMPVKRRAVLIGHEDKGKIIETVIKEKPDCIFVDETQFLSVDQIYELSRVALDYNISVYAYGLLIDYKSELFLATKKVIELGFSLQELKMQCDYCVEKSTHHLLFIDNKVVTSGDGIFVGDTEYKSVCRKCYELKTNGKED